MRIDVLEKPGGQWCRHCTPGRGCGVYDERPPVCSDFSCLWLMEPSLPDSVRPDRSKLVITGSGPQVMNVHCDPAEPMAWRREPMIGFLREMARNPGGPPIMVLARAGTRAWVVGAADDIDLGHIDPASPVRFEPAPGGGMRPVVLPPMSAEALAAEMAERRKGWT